MAMPKSPEELQRMFEEIVPRASDVTVRKMFGCPSAFVNVNLFMGLFGDGVILRLPADVKEALLKSRVARVFALMANRPMREYVSIPSALSVSRTELIKRVAIALEFGRSLPAKQPKPEKAKSARSART